MWEPLEIEGWLDERLKQQLGPSTGQALTSAYNLARNYLITQVLEEIKVNEPQLSDHGPRHIHEVLQNVQTLVWPRLATAVRQPLGGQIEELLPHEVFLLVISCIFHDVGNVFKRSNHNNRIISILNDAYPQASPNFLQVRSLVQQIAGAHTGLANGSNDTLQHLAMGQMAGLPVKVRDLAAILRLADELAEGPHRTSEWRYRKLGYAESSKIFHLYAQSCQRPTIDMASGRVALMYVLDLHTKVVQKKSMLMLQDIQATEILNFIYKRVIKLDQERKYTKHYSNFLSRIRETSVVFEFYVDGHPVKPELPPLVLSDVVVPGEAARAICDVDGRYDAVQLHEALLTLKEQSRLADGGEE